MLKLLLFLIILFFSCQNEDKSLIKSNKNLLLKKETTYFSDTLKVVVSKYDKTFYCSEEDMGVGDDGIYNLQNPSFTTNVIEKIEYPISNISDWDLKKAFVFDKNLNNKNKSIFVEFNIPHFKGKELKLFSISSIFIYNGYRKSKDIWQNNSRIKSMKLYVNNDYCGIINLFDTYILQIVEIDKLNIFYYSGKKLKFEFEIIDYYLGDKYPNDAAISEIELVGSNFY
jgi:hypothetical protein